MEVRLPMALLLPIMGFSIPQPAAMFNRARVQLQPHAVRVKMGKSKSG